MAGVINSLILTFLPITLLWAQDAVLSAEGSLLADGSLSAESSSSTEGSLSVEGFISDEGSLSALEILERMQEAAKTLNYIGTMVYTHDGNTESMRIVHSFDDKGEHERLLHLNGSPREVIRENNLVTCILPDNKSVMVEKRQSNRMLFSKLPDNLSAFDQYYELGLEGKGRIAGRETAIVSVRPKDAFRYGYRLWIDSESGLLLQSELLDENERVIEQIMFIQVELVDKVPPELLKPTVIGDDFVHYQKTVSISANADYKQSQHWKMASLPVGFKSSQHVESGFAVNDQIIDHFEMNDGVASISVYIEKLDKDKEVFLGSSYMGAVNVYGRVIDNFQITVVGEVPRVTVKMVADSIFYNQH